MGFSARLHQRSLTPVWNDFWLLWWPMISGDGWGLPFPDIYLTLSSAHSSTFPSLHLRLNSFSNPSVALPTSQLILQPFRCFTYVTTHSPTILSLHLRHRLFTYVTWRAAHDFYVIRIRALVIIYFVSVFGEYFYKLYSNDDECHIRRIKDKIRFRNETSKYVSSDK